MNFNMIFGILLSLNAVLNATLYLLSVFLKDKPNDISLILALLFLIAGKLFYNSNNK